MDELIKALAVGSYSTIPPGIDESNLQVESLIPTLEILYNEMYEQLNVVKPKPKTKKFKRNKRKNL